MKKLKYNSKHEFGFTLLHLQIVLSLLILIVALALPCLSALKKYHVRAELNHLYAVCKYMQQRAMTTHQDLVLTFDLKNNMYSSDKKKYQLPNAVQFGYIKGVGGPPSNPKKALTISCTFANNTITFYKTGIVEAGSIYLTNDKHSCMYALSNAISHMSFLRMYVYNKKWVLIS